MAVEANLSSIVFLRPLLAFALVFIVSFAVLRKSKILGEEPFIHVLVAFLMGTVFASFGGVRSFVLAVVPWFAFLFVVMFFIMLFAGLSGNNSNISGKGLTWTFTILFGIIILFVGVGASFSSIVPYLPGPYYGYGANPQTLFFFNWFYSPRIWGTFWFVLIAGLVVWIAGRN